MKDRAKDAVASMIKRLAHRNANVQLYTLEVDTHAHDDKKLADGGGTACKCSVAELRN